MDKFSSVLFSVVELLNGVFVDDVFVDDIFVDGVFVDGVFVVDVLATGVVGAVRSAFACFLLLADIFDELRTSFLLTVLTGGVATGTYIKNNWLAPNVKHFHYLLLRRPLRLKC